MTTAQLTCPVCDCDHMMVTTDVPRPDVMDPVLEDLEPSTLEFRAFNGDAQSAAKAVGLAMVLLIGVFVLAGLWIVFR